MKKYLLYILILGALVGLFSTTMSVHAQTSTPTGNYNLLAPLPCPDGATGCTPDANGNPVLSTYNPTDTNSIGGYLNLMIKIFIGICAVLAVVMIVMGGVEYMTSELIGNKEAGKNKIRNAIFGLLLALGAWTILNQINPKILNTDLSVSLPQQTVNVDLQTDTGPQTPTIVNGKAMYGAYASGSNFIADFPQNCLRNCPSSNLQDYLPTLPAGVSINKAQCVNVGDTNCTSTLGLNTSTINSLESGCTQSNNGNACPITITAGTEFWLHSANTSHQPGTSTVDLSATPVLTSYLTGGSSTFPTGATIPGNGICYYAEPAGTTPSTTGNHWHVYVPSSGTCNKTS